MTRQIKSWKPLLLGFFVLFAMSALFFGSSHKAFADTPVPAQCIVNANVLGGSAAYARVACNSLGDGGTFADGKCYDIGAQPAAEVDCTKPPINNLWTFNCQGSDTVFQSYIVGDPNNPSSTNPDNDPVKQCTAAGGTYVPSAGAPPSAPTGAGTTGTTPAPTTPTAPSGSGPTTGANAVIIDPSAKNPFKTSANDGAYWCGFDSNTEVHLTIDLGCEHKDPAILDLIFAIIRLLSDGVGIIVVGSIVFAGIQYTASRGDPQEVAKAQERVRSSVIALLIFLFSYAILNWLVPAGLLH